MHDLGLDRIFGRGFCTGGIGCWQENRAMRKQLWAGLVIALASVCVPAQQGSAGSGAAVARVDDTVGAADGEVGLLAEQRYRYVAAGADQGSEEAGEGVRDAGAAGAPGGGCPGRRAGGDAAQGSGGVGQVDRADE